MSLPWRCLPFEKRGWTSDQLQELMMNFQRKHGKKVPLPKIYANKDSSDSEGLELQDWSRLGRKASGGGSGRGSKCSHDDFPNDDPNKCRKMDPSPLQPPLKEILPKETFLRKLFNETLQPLLKETFA